MNASDLRGNKRGAHRSLFSSPLTRRILAINVLTLVIPIVGLLYLDDYHESLLEAEVELLTSQGKLIASSLANTAVLGPGAGGEYRLVPEWSRQSISQLIDDLTTRIRLFSSDGVLIADSARITAGGLVKVEPLPELTRDERSWVTWANKIYDYTIEWLPSSGRFPPYTENIQQTVGDYREAIKALNGDTDSAIRDAGDGKLILSVALPVQRYRNILGVLLVSNDSANVSAALRNTRFTVLSIFALALTATILLSIYLASRIAWPLSRLARAAEKIREAKGRSVDIPDLADRKDEIGHLSVALREMMVALQTRMKAIEQFAADVAHEIKNPLTSLRSAVETVARIDDPAQQKKLMGIILDDVARLNRLITDISDASRIDTEMLRDEMAPVDLSALLETLTGIYLNGGARIDLSLPPDPLIVWGQEGRISQVLRNLIVNAQSFSPADAKIAVRAMRRHGLAILYVDDVGPGIPPSKLEKIFERFYTSRPEGEKFGTHSGLGLSISRQIVEAHGGRLRAENRLNEQGATIGARFVLELPLVTN